MENNPSQSNGNMPFGVDINDYGDADVVAFGTTMHKLSNLRKAVNDVKKTELTDFLCNEFSSRLKVTNESWVTPGTDCEILKVGGKDWKKGKIKVELTVKFYPDEPETEEVSQADSSFDDIRLMVNKIS